MPPASSTLKSLELKIPPVALAFLVAALTWGAARLAPAAGFPLPAGRFIAGGLALAGLLVAIEGVIAFHRARTTVNPLQPGAASALVVSGIYRLTRNPMYLGLLLVLFGWALFLANAAAFVGPAVFVLFINRLQIIPEERALTAKFGPEFVAYQARVRRWL